MVKKKYVNPFYILLLVAGATFAISACAYGVMTVQMLDGLQAAEIRESGVGLVYWLDKNGFRLLMIELVVLAIAVSLAIGTDGFWSGEWREQRATATDSPDLDTASSSVSSED